ncbi:hypothetical protein A5834_001688, partial [Enterococcus faecium]
KSKKYQNMKKYYLSFAIINIERCLI